MLLKIMRSGGWRRDILDADRRERCLSDVVPDRGRWLFSGELLFELFDLEHAVWE